MATGRHQAEGLRGCVFCDAINAWDNRDEAENSYVYLQVSSTGFIDKCL